MILTRESSLGKSMLIIAVALTDDWTLQGVKQYAVRRQSARHPEFP